MRLIGKRAPRIRERADSNPLRADSIQTRAYSRASRSRLDRNRAPRNRTRAQPMQKRARDVKEKRRRVDSNPRRASPHPAPVSFRFRRPISSLSHGSRGNIPAAGSFGSRESIMPSHRPMRGSRGGFSLLEVMVVIAISAVLIGILMPALRTANEAARATRCSSQLRQIGVAIFAYASANRGMTPPWGGAFSIDNTSDPSQIGRAHV